MSICSTPNSIYHMQINSIEDIEKIFQNGDLDQKKITEILKRNYRGIGNKIDYPELGALFKNAYNNSLTFTTSLDIVEEMNKCQKMLEYSIIVCNNILSLGLIHSIKCHQTALQNFEKGGHQETAIIAMSETGEIAKKLASECRNISEQFSLSYDRMSKVLCSLANNNVQIYQKLRAEGEEGNTASILKRGISWIDSAINDVWKIGRVLLNIRSFWESIEHHLQGSLSSPLLADRNWVDLLECNETSEAGKEFCEMLEKAEKVFDIMMPEPKKEKNLAEVVKTMKTGRNNTIATDSSTSFAKMVKSGINRGIEQEFEDSYLNWLAFAKLTQQMVTATKQALVEIEEKRNEISQIEQDPLVIALHTKI